MSSPVKDSFSRVGRLNALFTEHPASINESYFQHFRHAMRYAGILGVTAVAAALHALIPCLCETTARRKIASLNEELQSRSSLKNN